MGTAVDMQEHAGTAPASGWTVLSCNFLNIDIAQIPKKKKFCRKIVGKAFEAVRASAHGDKIVANTG
jgi:hypothetical protein